MSWDQGEPTGRRSRRAPVLVAGIVLAVLLFGFLTRQTTPTDTLDVQTEAPDQPLVADNTEPAPPPTVSEQAIDARLPGGTGLTLWAIDTQGELTRVNLDTGETARVRVVDGPRVDDAALLPTDDGIVVVSFAFDEGGALGEARYVVSTLDASPVVLGPAQRALPSLTPGRVWLLEGFPWEATRLREVSYDGTVTAEVALPLGVSVHAAVEGGLLVNATGAVVVYDPVTQQGRTIADGTVLAADTQRVLHRVCDEALRCRAAMGPPQAPDAANVTLPPEAELALTGGYLEAALSPSGRWVALDIATQDRPRLAVLDVTNGGLRSAPDSMQPGDQAFGPSGPHFAWAPSGEWLFGVDDRGGVHAWNVLDNRLAPIDVDLPGIAAIAVS